MTEHSKIPVHLEQLFYSMFEIPFNKTPFEFPQNTFGIFVTIYRNGDKSQTVHGCKGYYSPNQSSNDKNRKFSQVIMEDSNENLNEAIYKVLYDSQNNDKRNEIYINQPLKNDPDIIIEVHCLLLPLYDIDSKTGRITQLDKDFRNEEYGLLYYTTYPATYLIDVFKNTSWDDIKQSLIDKSMANTYNGEFYAYEEIRWSIKFTDVLKNDKLVIDPIVAFVQDKYTSNVFIVYNVINDLVGIREEQIVRNLACIITLYPHVDDTTKNKMRNNVLEYCKMLTQMKKTRNNALEWGENYQGIIHLLHFFYSHTSYINNNNECKPVDNLVNYVGANLENIDDKDFTLGQALLILTYIKKSHEIEFRYLDVFTRDNHTINIQRRDDITIFKYNWHVQFLVALYSKYPENRKIIKYADLINRLDLYNKLQEAYKPVNQSDPGQRIETNEYAVLFEMYTGLYNILKDHSILKIVSELYIELLRKRSLSTGLFEFTNGEQRLDIACHVVNGLKNLTLKNFR